MASSNAEINMARFATLGSSLDRGSCDLLSPFKANFVVLPQEPQAFANDFARVASGTFDASQFVYTRHGSAPHRHPFRHPDARQISDPLPGRRGDPRARHRPQHDGVLRRQRRPVQRPAVPGRRSHRVARRHDAVAEPAATANRRTGSRGLPGAADRLRARRRVRVRADQPRHRRGTARAIQRRPAHGGGIRGDRRSADARPRLP